MFAAKQTAHCLFLGFLLALSMLLGAAAQQIRPVKPRPRPQNEVIQEFPSNDVMKTAWKVHYATMTGYGLVIQDAWFKKGPKEPWIQILADARLSELFVPYHSGSPRFWDVSYNFDLCPVTSADAGPFGRLLGSPPRVVQEIRDRGIAWVDSHRARRGQVMVLRATLNAANYRYVIEYGFQDDGVINFRCGSTGRNYSSKEWEGHMHNTLWRVDVDLDGPDHNSVYVMEHQEPTDQAAKASTTHKPFNDGKEGFLDWDPEKFTMLQVRHETRKNLRGMPIAYDLVPLRMGNARHFGRGEECTRHDFWVTRMQPREIYYKKLPHYIDNAEAIMDTDIVLWHSAPGHHQPRSEDGEMKEDDFVGVTPVMWSGFDLRPRDFFDRSPHYP